MKYRVSVDDQEVLVEIIERDGRVFVVRDGSETPAELQSVRNGAYSLLLGMESVPVVASGPNDDLSITLGAETWRASVRDERESLAAEALGDSGRSVRAGPLRAVMPGIVRDVLVQPGAEVARGTALLILEAMKMQNEVRADAPGRVVEVHVTAGTAVAKGDPLVTLGG